MSNKKFKPRKFAYLRGLTVWKNLATLVQTYFYNNPKTLTCSSSCVGIPTGMVRSVEQANQLSVSLRIQRESVK